MKHPIPFRSWTGRAALEIEIPDGTEERWRLKVAVEIAVQARADLSGADLSGAYLSGAYLSGAYLSGAHLSAAPSSRRSSGSSARAWRLPRRSHRMTRHSFTAPARP